MVDEKKVSCPVAKLRTAVNESRVDVCLSPGCVLASSAILESLDNSVDPCIDFYSHVCGGWIEKHPIPKG